MGMCADATGACDYDAFWGFSVDAGWGLSEPIQTTTFPAGLEDLQQAEVR